MEEVLVADKSNQCKEVADVYGFYAEAPLTQIK